MSPNKLTDIPEPKKDYVEGHAESAPPSAGEAAAQNARELAVKVRSRHDVPINDNDDGFYFQEQFVINIDKAAAEVERYVQSRLAPTDEKALKELIEAYSDQNTKYIKALALIAKTEQAHCYAELPDSEVNEMMQTRFDLRKCGDIARLVLAHEAPKEQM